MRTKTLVSASVATLLTCNTATAVVLAGDLAIIGLYGDGAGTTNNGDAFSWVALNKIGAGEVIYFSDSSYEAAGGGSYRPETLIRLTVTAEIPAGTISSIEYGNISSPYQFVTGATAYTNGLQSTNAISGAGEQLWAFQDADVSNSSGITPIHAVNSASTGWAADNSNSASDLYPGLTNGVNAVAAGAGPGPRDEYDNVRYTGPTSGSATFLAAEIAKASNWEGADATQANYLAWSRNDITSFTVVPEPSSAILLGLGGLGFFVRRKRH